MAAEDEGKTEQATGRRLSKAYEEGQIPFGRDALAVGNLAFALVAFSALAGPLRDSLTQLIRERFSGLGDASGVRNGASGLFTHTAFLGLEICAACAAGAVAVGLAQTRGGFWLERVAPDIDRLFSNRFSAIFSGQLLTDIGLSVIKVAAIFFAVSGMWRDRFLALPTLLTAPVSSLLGTGGAWLFPIIVRAVLAAGAIAGVDLAVQHWRFRKRLKMTRDEIKREGREENGDPAVKGKRRRRARELSRGRVAIEVPKADALLVNPTHVAIAIRYRKDESAAPRVTAKGKGKLAEIMRDLARENGIPIVEDIALARLLYRRVKVGRQIPQETFKAVAAILAFVYRLTGRKFGAGAATGARAA